MVGVVAMGIEGECWMLVLKKWMLESGSRGIEDAKMRNGN